MKRAVLLCMVVMVGFSMTACKKESDSAEVPEKKTQIEEVEKNPSVPLPLRFLEMTPPEEETIIADIVEVSLIDVDDQLVDGFERKNDEMPAKVINELKDNFKVIKIVGVINSPNRSAIRATDSEDYFKIFQGKNRVDYFGKPVFKLVESFEEGKSKSTLYYFIAKEEAEKGGLQVRIKSFIDPEGYQENFVDVSE